MDTLLTFPCCIGVIALGVFAGLVWYRMGQGYIDQMTGRKRRF